MWFQTRRKLQRLERHLARVEQQLSTIAHAVTHQPASNGPSVGELVGTLAQGQVQQIEATGGFIRLIHEIAVDRMGAAMGKRRDGQRGGKARAARAIRDSRGRMMGSRERSNCILCDDPLTPNFTVKDFEEHQGHKNRGNYDYRGEPKRPDAASDIEVESHTHPDGTVHYGPAHDPQPTYPLPTVSLGHDHGGTSGDSSESGSASNGAPVQ